MPSTPSATSVLRDAPDNALDRALEDAIARFSAANPLSKEQHQRASRSMPGGNTRSILYTHPFPLTVVKGEGARLMTLDPRTYIDFLGEYTAGLYGHSDPTILAAARSALEMGLVLGGQTEIEERFASALKQRFAALERVRFTNSGTEANLMAISLARAHTGRTAVIVFEGAYHGSVFNFSGASDRLNAPFPFMRLPYNDPEQFESTFAPIASEVAAVLVEPMMGAGGCIPADPDFLRLLRDRCTAAGALLIFDEVMTSRLAPGGMQQIVGVTPDLMTMGKYLGGGFSFGGFGGREAIMRMFDPSRPGFLPHAGTFNNNICSMAAGLAGLTKLYTPEANVRLNRDGDALREALQAVIRNAGLAMQVTGRGSMMTIHMVGGAIRNFADIKRANPKLGALLYYDLIERGIWMAKRGMCNLSLPMTQQDREALIAAVTAFVTERAKLF